MTENKTDLFTRATEAARYVADLTAEIAKNRASLKFARQEAAKLRKQVIEAMGPAKVRTRKKRGQLPSTGVCEHGKPLSDACGDCMALARLTQERGANGE